MRRRYPDLSSAGIATCTLSYPGPGSHQIVASWGDVQSQILTQTVNQAATTTQVTWQLSIGIPGDPHVPVVLFTATVSANPPGAGTPTGTVQFAIDGNQYASPVALVHGTAQVGPFSIGVCDPKLLPCTVAVPDSHVHMITATYSGDSDFSASTGTLTFSSARADECAGLAHLLSTYNAALADLVLNGQGNSPSAQLLRQAISATEAAETASGCP